MTTATAAGDGLPDITRREALKAGGAAAALTVGAAGAAGAAVASQGSLRDLYFRWKATTDAYNASDGDDEILEAMIAIERRAAEFVPTTVEDYAFKVIFADDDGDMSMSLAKEALVAGAYRIAGVAGWTEQREAALLEWRASVWRG